MAWHYNLEDLRRYYHEGKGIRWDREADDPVSVELRVDNEGRTTGRINLSAYLTDNDTIPVGWPYKLRSYNTNTKTRNLMSLTERMETLQSRGLREEAVRLDHRGVTVSYDRNISTESDLSDMVEDIASVM